jgi:pimeloyl-ACP methyl ester carboxylesterase
MAHNRNPKAIRTTVLALAVLSASVSLAAAGSLGGPLELQDEGVFFISGQTTQSNFPDSRQGGVAPGQIRTNQMYVQYRIPKTIGGAPIIMVHGSGHTGVTYETTPDGREGWATYFARRNFPVFVVDHAGRGRSGFDPTPVNRAKVESNPALIPPLPLFTRERAFSNFRMGSAYPNAYPGQQFPLDAMDQYLAELVPNAENTLEGGGANTVKALVALVDKIGPSMVMVHSQGGAYGLELVRQRPDKVRALIDVEGSCGPLSADDVSKAFSKVPTLIVVGDYFEHDQNGAERNKLCNQTVDAINAAGGSAKFLSLPAAGIKGNGHMLMMEKNNLQIADLIIGWVGQQTAKR